MTFWGAFCILLENSAMKKKLVYSDHQNVNSLCLCHHYVNSLCQFCVSVRAHIFFGLFANCYYYIKVSGIPTDNKLIKTIRYPHMRRYDIFTCEDDDFTDIKFVS